MGSLVRRASGFNFFFFVVPFFNLFSGLAVGVFNEFVGTALSPFDPFSIEKTLTQDLGSVENDDCGTVDASADFTFGAMTGFSEMTIKEVAMTDFGLFGVNGTTAGFNIEIVGESLLLDVLGSVGVEGCDQAAGNDFTGTVGINNPIMKFNFDGLVRPLELSIDSVTINTFEFDYEDIGINLSDLGDYEDLLASLTDMMNSQADSILSTFIDATFLQNAIDLVLPFPPSG